MKEQKIVYSCDHVINTVKHEAKLYTITKSDGDSDLITNEGTVSEVFYVNKVGSGGAITVEDSALTLEEGSEAMSAANSTLVFSETSGASVLAGQIIIPNDSSIYYEQGADNTTGDYYVDGNTIIWNIPAEVTVGEKERPQAGTDFICEAYVNYRYVKDYNDNPDLCERCSGAGWYVSPLASIYRRFETTTNATKLVQDYIKIVYTEYDEDTEYGCNIVNMRGTEVFDKQQKVSEVCSELQTAASRLKYLQQKSVNNGSAYTDAELLNEIIINNTEFDDDSMNIYIDMSIFSMAGTSARFTLEL